MENLSVGTVLQGIHLTAPKHIYDFKAKFTEKVHNLQKFSLAIEFVVSNSIYGFYKIRLHFFLQTTYSIQLLKDLIEFQIDWRLQFLSSCNVRYVS